jgi:large subunit ribosomal protein L29
MKVDELRVLEEDELGTRLKAARRELYELRFKHAVGQLENSSQISKARHDIARIMTVLTEREYGFLPSQPQPEAEVVTRKPSAAAVAEPAEDEVKAKPKRTRKKTEEAS